METKNETQNTLNERWFELNHPGSDNSYYWGTKAEAGRWYELTGEELEAADDYAEGSTTNEYNLLDELNKIQ